MKYLKYFSLFESKTHTLFTFPKNDEELNDFRESPGFQKFKSIGIRDLSLMRNKGIEFETSGYTFKISPNGIFRYGGYTVGPKYDTNIDNWDMAFDYAYTYILGNSGYFPATSYALENFVFHGEINSNLYNNIKNKKEFADIMAMAKKYNGSQKIDAAIDKIITDTGVYIKDARKILETPVYNFFAPIFDFQPQIIDEHTIRIYSGNSNPFGIFGSNVGTKSDSSTGPQLYVALEGSEGPVYGKTRVKSMKALDNSLFRKIQEDYSSSLEYTESAYYIAKFRDTSYGYLRKISLGIFKSCLDAYKSGNNDLITNYIESEKKSIEDYLNNWKGEGEEYLNILIPLIDSKMLNDVALRCVNSDKTREILTSLKSEKPLVYSKILDDISKNPNTKDAFSNVLKEDDEIIRGGRMLRRFGLDGE